MSNQDDKYNVMGTKISPAMAEVINAICDVLQTDVYHLLQQFLYTLIRASSQEHKLSPEIQKIMAMLESDSGWQNAFNLCNPGGLDVAQMVLILQQKGKKGFGAVMINRPFMDTATQTECVDDILERVTEVCMHGIYRRLRILGGRMGCNNLSDLLLRMIDAQTIQELDEENMREMTAPGNFTEYGKEYAYGKRTKAKHHRNVDTEAERQLRIRFEEYDKEIAKEEANEWENHAKDLEDSLGCRPFTDEA